MSAPAPELIFIAGPQEGQRAVLMGQEAYLGRAPDADVHLQEEFASRRHIQFQATPEGWVMENLSAGGTHVNGKRYKFGKKILLETGDVLGVGKQTEILFVSAGDDPDEALAAYREAHPAAPALEPEAPAPQAPPPDEQAAPEGPKTPTEPPQEIVPPELAAKRAKRKKYLIFGGVYVVAMVALFSMLPILCNRDKPNTISGLNRLTPDEIDKVLRSKSKRLPDSTAAANELAAARAMYPNRHLRKGDLYRCVVHFKEHLAYRNSLVFADYRDGQKYQIAANELVKLVQGKYHNAWAYAKSRNWKPAADGFDELLRIVPADERTDPQVYEELVTNFRAHLAYVRRHIRR